MDCELIQPAVVDHPVDCVRFDSFVLTPELLEGVCKRMKVLCILNSSLV